MAVVISILILSFLVIIHELGHYLAARFFKIKVEEFGLGYPPRALTVFKKWGSEFTLNWIPFGGFVRMEGEFDTTDPESLAQPEASTSKKKSKKSQVTSSEEGPFYSKSAPARLVVILAGALVNFIFAIVAFSIVFSLAGLPSGAIIDSTAEGSPAQQSGLPAKVAIVGIKTSEETRPVTTILEAQDIIRQHPGESLILQTVGPCEHITCQDEAHDYTVYVRRPDETPEGQGAVGIAFYSDFYKYYPWYEMPVRGSIYGIQQALGTSVQIVRALGSMVGNLVFKGIVPADVKGPVGIVDQAQKTGLFTQGPLVTLLFSGMLSLNLAVMNVLPIPALDGGQALFIILERIIGRHRVDKVRNQANYAGFAVLITLILLITSRDIWNIVKGI